jgi:hypothetical protein
MKQSHYVSGVLIRIQELLLMAFAMLTAALLMSQLAAAQLSEAGSDDIGLTELRTENPGLTEGVGIKGHLVEAYFGADRYVPNPNDVQLSDNAMDIIGSPATAVLSEITSGHALISARFFFGSNGVARDLGTGAQSIDIYAAAPMETPNDNTPTVDWLNFNVFNGSGDPNLPEFDRSTVSSHSYIFTADPMDQLPDLMQRLDHIINETDTTTVVGTGNSGSIPPGWAPAYNVIAVGLSAGTHSSGLTTTYGSGRVAIDIVAPAPNASSATPVVAGAVAILQDAADGSDASTSEVIRATILAGATKGAGDIAGTWSRTNTQPLDLVYGAGELNILNSYNIQQGGESNGGATTPVSLPSLYGWDYESSLEVNGQRLYEFEVSAGTQLEDLSVVLAWNQNIVDTNGNPNQFVPVEELANLSLELLDSTGATVDFSFSDVDNVEHVFQDALTAGIYQLRVSNDNGFASDYGLAWRGDLVVPLLLGDCDLNGVVDFSDIPAFIAILIAGGYLEEADCNQDGIVDFEDIPSFVLILNAI